MVAYINFNFAIKIDLKFNYRLNYYYCLDYHLIFWENYLNLN